ncbi:hypothetical protein [Streptomyces sp. NPDC058861]|uniref:hypothetical protein n=1 Tax=Streptomyces sp. NPDC058861 TaxID=3346653 RepID=UPI0036AB91C3
MLPGPAVPEQAGAPGPGSRFAPGGGGLTCKQKDSFVIIAQSMVTTLTQTVPVAALTTVVAGYFLAGPLAHRQEAGKQRAAAELELGALVVGMRREVEVARAKWAASSTFTPEAFTGRRLDAFVVGLVDGARKLTGRRQSRVRERLVVLVGEWQVRMAEELDDTNPPAVPMLARGDQVVVPQASEAARGWFTAYFEAGGHPMEGLLGNLATSQAPTAEFPPVLEAFDRLLDAVGGRVGLAGRTER